jgi:disulfide bond formation protein DsbB
MATLTASAATGSRSRTHLLTAAFLMLAMAATVGTALGFQHLGGYIPCKLCLEQRTPYYVGVPLMALTLLSAALNLPSWITRFLLLAGAILMAYSLYLGVHHAGVEWGWWAGPTDCGAVEPPASGGSGGILDQIDKVIPPSCDKAALRVLGLSFAGWNAVASFILALVALWGASRKA